jgi:hypothetical protein
VRVTASGVVVRDEVVAQAPTSLAIAPSEDVVVLVDALGPADVVLAQGRSLHVVVAAGTAPSVVVELLPPGRFTRLCGDLSVPRSGHAALLLADGSVIVSGGNGDDGDSRSSMELLSFEVTPQPMLAVVANGNRIPWPLAHHALTLLPQTGRRGQFLVTGGDRVMGTSTGTSAAMMVVDPDVNFVTGLLSPTPTPKLRARHVAQVVDGGVVLFGGEVGWAVLEFERIDLGTFQHQVVGFLPSARMDAALGVLDGRAVLAGGVDQGVANGAVDLAPFDQPSQPTRALLQVPRTQAAVVTLGERALILGGFDAAGAPVGASEWLTSAGVVSSGPSLAARARPCVAKLSGERALVLGGRDASGPSAAAELVGSDGAVVTLGFPGLAREEATCTTLEDGSVLVVGGRGATHALGDAWRFVPPAQ